MSRLIAAPGVIALVGARVTGPGVVGASGNNTLRPFIEVRAGSLTPAVGSAVRQPFYVYAHVEPGSALAVDTILAAVKVAMTLSTPDKNGAGPVIMECRWDGESDDLFDDGYGTTVRYATYALVSSP
jgi:hypothetical protein